MTIKDVIKFTHQFYENRFDYKTRDVLQRITIKEVKEIQRHDQPGLPRERKKFVIESYSYPQYPPYKPRSKSTRQRKIRHQYDVVFELDRLSINTEYWTSRVGSGKTWLKKPPQKDIKSLYEETKKEFRKKAERGARTKREANEKYKQLVEKHKRKAKYLDVGDYNSRVRGLNGDWIFRCDYAYYFNNLRYGRNYYGNVSAPIRNPNNDIFFTKHQLGVIEQLMNRGILKDN